MKNILLTGLALPILFGCSLTEKKSEIPGETATQPFQIVHPVEQDATMAYRSKERVGAAYNMEAYVHVLGQRESSLVEIDLPENRNLPQSAAEVLDAINQIDGNDKLRSYSLYEMSRWQRFCDAGKGMDQKDWLFVVGEGGSEAVPTNLDNCQLPKFSYQDYLSAWAKHCSGDAITNSEAEILRNTEIAKKVCKDNLPSS